MKYDVTKGGYILLGRCGENLARTVEIDVSEYLVEYPGAVVTLLHRRHGESGIYPVAAELRDGCLVWQPTSADTAIAGSGEAEVRVTVNGVLAKSKILSTVVDKSLTGQETDAPEPGMDWVDKITTAIGSVQNMKADAESVAYGEPATAEYDGKTGTMHFGIPEGRPGRKGDTGAQGPKGDSGSDAEVTAANVEAALGYVPANEILQAKTDMAILGDELVSAEGWVLGEGWSGTAQNGITHASGTGHLSYSMPESTKGNCYQVSFKSSVAMTDSNLFVSVGNSPLFNLYYEEHHDGTISVGVLAADNGDLVFVPANDYAGTISNVSVRRILGAYMPIKQLLDASGEVSTEIYASPREQNNLYVGTNAGRTNTTGNRNVAIGANALLANLSGWRNIAIGSGTLKTNTSGSRNTAIGEDALSANQSGQRNIAIGTSTLTKITNSNRNIAIGADCMFEANNCDDCIAMGFAAMNRNKGSRNYGIGTTALYNATGALNIAFGYSAGYGVTTGENNVAIGTNTLYRTKNGKNNVAIGANALQGATDSDYSNYNVAIGYAAGKNIGRYGSNNVMIGANVAATLSGADYCIIIGSNQDADASVNHQLNIGGLLKGSLDNNAAYLQIDGGLELSKIPTADPQIAGRVWNDNGTLKISAGGTV